MKKEQRYVILGNSTAAVAAAEAIRSVDSPGSITLVAEEPYHTYSRPLISYYLSGQVSEEQMLYRPLEFYQENRIATRLGTTAALLDTVKRRVYLTTKVDKNQETYIEYDKLLLATGSRPASPPIPGIKLKGVHYFYTLDHIKAIQASLKKGSPVVVLGSGLIGMKAAEALCKLGLPVTVVEMADRILPTILDREAAFMVQSWMEEHGIRFLLDNRAAAICGEKQVDGVQLADGTELPAQLVIIATGVRPNVELAADTPIEVRQGIVVNEYQETSVPGIYCAGDVCEGYDPLYGQHRLSPILPNAYHQGRVAGLNMAGEKTVNSGLIAFNSTTFFGMPVATMGLSSAAAEGESFNYSRDREYRSLMFKGEQLVGGIFVNCAQRAGIFQQLIKERAPVKQQKDYLLQSVPRLIDFPSIQW
ncbi:MAG: NAD(P)/FAD-dependent oxidoreductase [Firmicutes bacterium]|nr:NAD(P)/FAD-dependent oxidoreductase [Bacillota bacterium]